MVTTDDEVENEYLRIDSNMGGNDDAITGPFNSVYVEVNELNS